MLLKTKKALVTGGSRGIGEAIARRLHKDGCELVLTGKNSERLQKITNELGATAWQVDFADKASTTHFLTKIRDFDQGFDIVINNAGVAKSASLKNSTDEDWQLMMGVNAFVPFKIIQAATPAMRGKSWGRIVNIASNAGVSGYNYSSIYCATKHALVGLTRSVAVELAKTNITINAICPGWVDTDIVTDATQNIHQKTGLDVADARKALAKMSPQNRIIEPSEVAHLVSMLCSSQSKAIHGQALIIDGGNILK